MKILMVCLGNICRSPLAEGILKSKVPKHIIIDSAGTAGYHIGKKPDLRSIEIAKKNGLDITQQKCRKFTLKDFDNFDVIYTMDINNYQTIFALAKNKKHQEKVKMILNELFPNSNKSVPDPYYGKADGFKQVYNMLNKACNIIASKINR